MSYEVDREVAEQEFNRFGSEMDLDFDVSSMKEEDREQFEGDKDRVIRAIMRGMLAINEKGEPTYTTRAGEELHFREPTGATFMAMDQKKKTHDVSRAFASLAEMTRTSAKTFANMPNRDLRVCLSIFALFQA